MVLTDFQKGIIESIADGNVTDINTFISYHCRLKKKTIKPLGRHKDFFKDFLLHSSVEYDVYIPLNREEFINKIKTFFLILKLLEREGLIYVRKKEDFKKDHVSIYVDNLNEEKILPDNIIFDIISPYYGKEIEFIPELNSLVDRNFLTREEQVILEEKRDRIKSQRLTLIVAVVSIFGTLFTVLFQYYTFTNERIVTIKNEKSPLDTINVRIIEKSEQVKIDSIEQVSSVGAQNNDSLEAKK